MGWDGKLKHVPNHYPSPIIRKPDHTNDTNDSPIALRVLKAASTAWPRSSFRMPVSETGDEMKEEGRRCHDDTWCRKCSSKCLDMTPMKLHLVTGKMTMVSPCRTGRRRAFGAFPFLPELAHGGLWRRTTLAGCSKVFRTKKSLTSDWRRQPHTRAVTQHYCIHVLLEVGAQQSIHDVQITTTPCVGFDVSSPRGPNPIFGSQTGVPARCRSAGPIPGRAAAHGASAWRKCSCDRQACVECSDPGHHLKGTSRLRGRRQCVKAQCCHVPSTDVPKKHPRELEGGSLQVSDLPPPIPPPFLKKPKFRALHGQMYSPDS